MALAAQPADLVVNNATIYTANPAQPRARAMAIRNGRITAIGDDVRNQIGPKTQVLDLQGASVIPGLIDSHVHLQMLGQLLEWTDMRHFRTVDEVAALVRRRAAGKPKGSWVRARNWDETNWGGAFPSHKTLTDAAPEHPVFLSREKKVIDICILNHGGIRSILPKGNVTTRTAFEIMPFENSLIIAELKGTEIREMANYILKERKPHPLSGLEIIIDKNTMTVKSLSVKGKPLDDSKTYYVATSDYLSNGGDNMTFFKKAVKSYDMNYKLRNIMIDYFKKTDTIPIITNKRIILE